MNKMTVAAKRFGGFMKRNAFYFLIILCIASVATVIALAATGNFSGGDSDLSIGDDSEPTVKPGDDDKDPSTPEEPEEPEEQTFIAPTNGTSIRDFSDSEMVWNPTLGQYETHLGVDFKSDDLNVFAAAKGKVKEIGYNELDGNYVILTHEDGYETGYYSLESKPDLKAGDIVEQGDNLGKMSVSQSIESMDGAHLHFEVMKDGKHIDPFEVLVMEEK